MNINKTGLATNAEEQLATTFKALMLREQDGKAVATIELLTEDDLPEGDVTIAVSHSTLNYKDGMVLGGIGKLVRTYPHVPGIDFAGTVLSSQSSRYQAGDEVVLTGWRVGEAFWGGYSQRVRMRSEWLVPLAKGLSARDAMAIGTAGLTAMLCVMTLEEQGITPESGPVLVTGAAGGVGSTAIALLSHLGYHVVATTGRPELADYLKDLGAAEIIDRAELAEPTNRPLESEKWAAAIDSVGSSTLARLLGQMKYGGCVTSCGLAGGPGFTATVLPFLLRGVKLLGIDSVMQPYDRRIQAWDRLAKDLSLAQLEKITEVCALEDLPAKGADILKGKIRGRLVVDLRD